MVIVRKCAGLAVVLATVAATAGCVPPTVPTCAEKVVRLTLSASKATAPSTTQSATPNAAPHATPNVAGPSASGPSADPEAVAEQVRRAAGEVAAIVFDRAEGRYLLAEQPDRQFQAASLVKLLIALDRLASGQVDDLVAARLRVMLSASDDAQANGLWVAGGGGAIVRRMAASLGLSATAPEADNLWGYSRISAQDVLTVYRHILERLPEADRDLILSSLRAAPRIAADGFDQYFGIPDGLPGHPLAIKQGWSSGQGVLAVHSTGLVGAGDRYIVVLMTEHRATVGWPAAMALATEAARTLAPLLDQEPDG